LCSGELTTTKGRVVKKNQISQQIILKNNRLFIPGMVLLCNEKYYVFNCLKKRLDSIWQAKLDILKKKIWYQSKNVSLNKNQVFVGTCEKKNTK
jgi:hypothetical protein